MNGSDPRARRLVAPIPDEAACAPGPGGRSATSAPIVAERPGTGRPSETTATPHRNRDAPHVASLEEAPISGPKEPPVLGSEEPSVADYIQAASDASCGALMALQVVGTLAPGDEALMRQLTLAIASLRNAVSDVRSIGRSGNESSLVHGFVVGSSGRRGCGEPPVGGQYREPAVNDGRGSG
jgi:hypothetical protein